MKIKGLKKYFGKDKIYKTRVMQGWMKNVSSSLLGLAKIVSEEKRWFILVTTRPFDGEKVADDFILGEDDKPYGF